MDKKPQEHFPTEDDFKKNSEIIKWRELPLGIYLIQEFEKKKSKFGVSLILQLKSKSDELIRVWSPETLTTELLSKNYQYVFSEGLVKSEKTGNQYFKFPLM